MQLSVSEALPGCITLLWMARFPVASVHSILPPPLASPSSGALWLLQSSTVCSGYRRVSHPKPWPSFATSSQPALCDTLPSPFTIWRACWLEYLVIIWHGRHLRAADIALSRVLCAPARSRRCLHSARHDSCLPSQRNAVIRASFWLLAHSVPLFTRSRTSRFSASPDMSRARCSVQQQEEMFGGNGMRGERVRQHQAHCSWYVLALGRAGQLSLRYGCVLIASFLSWSGLFGLPVMPEKSATQ